MMMSSVCDKNWRKLQCSTNSVAFPNLDLPPFPKENIPSHNSTNTVLTLPQLAPKSGPN